MSKKEKKSDKDLKKRVSDITTINFNISKCPESVYNEFVQYCKLHCSDPFTGSPIYHMGLKMLLDLVKSDAKTEMFYRRLVELEDAMERMQQGILKQDKEKARQPIKTMGGVREEVKESG